ncbi:MAG: hypothetical protein CBC29_01030 [Methylococcaceae bacterium TMED69]|nr:MAG: hypothetical protein CBC29_01030 [Methylococcaceae bacterium TMED69]
MGSIRQKRLALLCGLTFALNLIAPKTFSESFEADLEQLIELNPKPGTLINSKNFKNFKNLIDPDIAKFIRNDHFSIRIGAPISLKPHPAFIFATRQGRSKATLSDEQTSLLNFSSGLPFSGPPILNEQDAGIKLAFNMRYAYLGDNGFIPEMKWRLMDWTKETLEFKMDFSMKLMRFLFRSVRQPTPEIKQNKKDIYGAAFLTAINAGSYSGLQALIYANRNEAKPPNGWVYVPQLERTQTLASFRNDDSMFGSDVLPTDFLSFSGSLAESKWNYLGTSYLLLPLYEHNSLKTVGQKSKKQNYHHVKFGGKASCFPGVEWQIREVHILEGIEKDSKKRAKRRIFYLDAQTHVPMIWKIYSQNKKLWKIVISAYSSSESHIPENTSNFAPVGTAFSTIDIQTNRCTTINMLTFINSDEVEVRDFDVTRMNSGKRFR